MVTNTERLAQTVKQEMYKRDWEAKYLAQRASVTEDALNRSLTGMYDWPLTRIFKIADAFGIKASELLAMAEAENLAGAA